MTMVPRVVGAPPTATPWLWLATLLETRALGHGIARAALKSTSLASAVRPLEIVNARMLHLSAVKQDRSVKLGNSRRSELPGRKSANGVFARNMLMEAIWSPWAPTPALRISASPL